MGRIALPSAAAHKSRIGGIVPYAVFKQRHSDMSSPPNNPDSIADAILARRGQRDRPCYAVEPPSPGNDTGNVVEEQDVDGSNARVTPTVYTWKHWRGVEDITSFENVDYGDHLFRDYAYWFRGQTRLHYIAEKDLVRAQKALLAKHDGHSVSLEHGIKVKSKFSQVCYRKFVLLWYDT